MTARQAYENYLVASGASQWLSWEGWQAAYAAGMERAAEICEEKGKFWAREFLTGEPNDGAEWCADAIRAEIKEPT